MNLFIICILCHWRSGARSLLMAAFNLVQYSSSESSGEETTLSADSFSRSVEFCHKNERKRKSSTSSPNSSAPKQPQMDVVNKSNSLPHPVALMGMFKSSDDCEPRDDPSNHMGRVRSFAHERGNWASFVSIPCGDSEEMLEIVQTLIEHLKPSVEFHPVSDFHISVSKTFVVLHHWIEPLVQDLKKNLTECKRGTVRLCSLELYCNEEQTRTFLGVAVLIGKSLLESYVQAIDKSLKEFRLPEYYKEPKFHVSLAWAVGDVRQQVQSSLSCLQDLLDRLFSESDDISNIKVSHLRLKAGNKTFILELPLQAKSTVR